ncbi:MAG: class II aldolase/adducin family protein [Desulfofustis sp.]|nr:class II aldolase/adducin family protein [Desulfofustis sp.]
MSHPNTPAGTDSKALYPMQQSKELLTKIARRSYERNLTTTTRGVISMRSPEAGLYLITSAETSFQDIKSTDVCLIDEMGTLVDKSTSLILPSETKYHLKSYQVRPDIHAIAHLYPPYVSAYALKNPSFNLTDTARSTIKEVLKVRCAECISRFCGLCDCRTDIRTSYTGVDVLLLKEDGLVTLGTSLENALDLADLVEKSSREALVHDVWKGVEHQDNPA